jgi:serine phosphatase RsbU (regulator of sigma subunit)
MELKLPFLQSAPAREYRKPAPAHLPELAGARIAARYREARMGGDFYDFTLATPTRLVFLLFDIAGKRDQALHLAAAVQDKFREVSPEIFGVVDLNEAEALSDLTVLLNRTLMDTAHGVHCAPGFLGSLDLSLGTLQYINAGHTPGFLRDADGVTRLPANGLPLGLFSHSTHDAQFAVLTPGSALLLVSKGVVEAKAKHQQEFGLDRLQQHLLAAPLQDPEQLSECVLESVDRFRNGYKFDNDVTALSLLRPA